MTKSSHPIDTNQIMDGITNGARKQISRPRRRSGASASIRKTWFPLLGFLIVLFSTAAQFECLNSDFVSDDHVLLDDMATRGCGTSPISCFSGRLFYLYYRPLVPATFVTVQKYHLHDITPDWFHVENLVLHAIEVAIAIQFFWLLIRKRVAALISAALFSLHPVQVCITAFIGGRTDSMALIFVLLFAIGLIRGSALYRGAKRLNCFKFKSRSFVWLFVSAVGLLFAEFTKEQSAMILVLAPLLAAHRHSLKRSRTTRGPNLGLNLGLNLPKKRLSLFGKPSVQFLLGLYTPVVLLFIIPAVIVLRANVYDSTHWSLVRHIDMIGRTLNYYGKYLLFPTMSTQHQATLGSWTTSQPGTALIGYLFACAFIALVRYTWLHNSTRILALWTGLTLLPCLNIVPMQGLMVGAYRAAIPLVGLAGLAGFYLSRPWYSKGSLLLRGQINCKLAFVGLLLICIRYTYFIISDLPNWRNDFVHSIALSANDPTYIAARSSVALNYLQPPDTHTADFSAALREYNICINQLLGSSATPANYVGLIRSFDAKQALHSGSGLSRQPESEIPELLRQRGLTLWNLNRIDDALWDFAVVRKFKTKKECIELATTYANAGNQMLTAKNSMKAIDCYRAAFQLDPGIKSNRAALTSLYSKSGNSRKALLVAKWTEMNSPEVIIVP